MLVLTTLESTSPCLLIMFRLKAPTDPETSRPLGRSGTSVEKTVSTRLKPVVRELAMLPEMFSSEKLWAVRPETAVVSAPKIPMAETSSFRDWTSPRPTKPSASGPGAAGPHAEFVPKLYILNILNF